MFKIVASNLDVHDLCIYNLNTIFINKKKKKNRKINERKIKKDKIELFKEIIIIQGTIKQSERVKRSGEAIVERGTRSSAKPWEKNGSYLEKGANTSGA